MSTFMLNSMKLNAALFFLCMLSTKISLANNENYYFIAKREGQNVVSIGNVIVSRSDPILLAHVPFSKGHSVLFYVMAVPGFVSLAIVPQGGAFHFKPLPKPDYPFPSHLMNVIRNATGLPSSWFTTPETKYFSFPIPGIEPQRVNYFASTGKADDGVPFFLAESINGITEAIWQAGDINDCSILQAIDMFIMTLITPQYLHNEVPIKRSAGNIPAMGSQPYAPVDGRFLLSVDLRAARPIGLGYELYIMGISNWHRFFIIGEMPQGYPSGGAGTIETPLGKRLCMINPFLLSTDISPSGFVPSEETVNHGGMPPQFCRNGKLGWPYQGGYGGGPGSAGQGFGGASAW